MKVTILGCGPSAGVPLIGCDCGVCTSDNPKNKRTRSSILIESDTTTILIDASPDLREQALRENIRRIDALVMTHAHADHCHGIDEMRSFNYLSDAVIPIYADDKTLKDITQRFGYLFLPPDTHWYRGALEPHIIREGVPFRVGDIELIPFMQEHGKSHSIGYKIGNFVYSTDVNNFPNDSMQYLENIDVWLVDSLREDPAPAHAHLALTLEWITQFKPRQAVLTHMSHVFNYDALSARLPAHVTPAFDGFSFEINR